MIIEIQDYVLIISLFLFLIIGFIFGKIYDYTFKV